jgi:hypothetical protein
MFAPENDPLLNIRAILSDANFGTTWRVFSSDDRSCPGPEG